MNSSDEQTQFLQVIKNALPSWANITETDVIFERLRGLTNQVYKVSSKDSACKPNEIIFRKFFEGKMLINRDLERKLFIEIAEKGFGPKCLYDSEKYRIEEWIDSESMIGSQYNETPEIRRRLARALATFHQLEISWLPRARFLADDIANPKIIDPFREKSAQKELFSEQELVLIEKLQTVISDEERKFIQSVIPKDDFVVSHNDLSLGNLLLTHDKSKIVLIDYEYAGKNFRGFDIGYLFHQGRMERLTDPPYFVFNDTNFPSDADLYDFCKYYIVFNRMSSENNTKLGDELIKNEESFEKFCKQQFPHEGELKKLTKNLEWQAKVGVLACCHYIMTWATTMSKPEKPVKFDHLAFAAEGYKYYQRMKSELLKEVQDFKTG